MGNFRDRQYVAECLLVALKAVQDKRHLRADYDLAAQRFRWNIYEQDLMHVNVNIFRNLLGKPPVAREKIVMADDSASGHVDYTYNFILGCVNLVFGE